MNVINSNLSEKFYALSVVQQDAEVSSEEMNFLMNTGLTNKISLFCNSTSRGIAEHQIKKDPMQGLMIKKERAWCALRDVMRQLQWDPQTEKLFSKNNPSTIWSYQSPDGLVPRNPFHYNELMPIEQLDAVQYEELHDRAKRFWENHDEVDIGELKPCILQIITTKKLKKPAWYLEDAFDSFPQHATIRLIDQQYNLYSCGIQMEKGVPGGLCQDSKLDCLAETEAHISSIDYEEAKGFDQKTITSIPITSNRLQDIVTFISETNQAGYRFSLLHHNCTSFAKNILEKAGITSVPRKITIFDYAAGLLPRLENIPVVGKGLASTIKVIQEAIDRVWQLFDSMMPQAITRTVSHCAHAIAFVPFFLIKKISTLACRAIMRNFGSDIKKYGACIKKRELSDEESCLIDSHTTLYAWQKRQASTVCRQYEGKRMLYL